LIYLISPVNKKAQLFLKSRASNSYKKVPEKKDVRRVWIHASSLGEFEQGRPLIERIKENYPKTEIVLTFFSPSGFEVRKKYEKANFVTYIPIDSPKNATHFLDHIQPDVAIMVKYEFWLNHLDACFHRDIPVVYVSAIFRENQVYFKSAKNLYLPRFQRIKYFFVQNEESLKILKRNGIEMVEQVGDTRFDRVIDIAENSGSIDKIEKFLNNESAIVLGSFWKSDWEIVKEFIMKISSKYKIIIAPHNVNESEIEYFQNQTRDSFLFSNESIDAQKQFLIINNMGMLATIYKYAKYAFVGGGFRGALHNTLEAAVYGIPIFFGRHEKNKKFNEAIDLLEGGGAYDFIDKEELAQKFNQLENDKTEYDLAADFSKEFVYRSKGSTGKIFDYLENNNLL